MTTLGPTLDPTLVGPPPPPAGMLPPPPPPAHHGRGLGWVVLGSALALVIVAWGTWSTVSLLGRRVRTERTVIERPLQVLDIRTDGTIRVSVGAEGRFVISERIERSVVAPERTQEVRNGVLYLRASCAAISNFCSVGYDVQVPPGTDLRLRSHGDDVRIEGVDGAIEARSSGGPVTVIGGRGPLRLDSSGGDVTVADGRSTDIEATSAGGGVSIDLDAAPTRIDATSWAGDVTVQLPRTESSFAVDASSSGGSSDVQVRTDPAAPRRIRAHSSGGDVSVRYR
jgi:hypothetical protein